jgi:hypothetical protein
VSVVREHTVAIGAGVLEVLDFIARFQETTPSVAAQFLGETAIAAALPLSETAVLHISGVSS